MHDVYIYDKGQDYDSLGLVGALAAASCVYDATAGEAGEITLEHPFDNLGRWSFLQEGRILKACVPVRVTPLLNISPTTQTIIREVYKVKTNGGRLRLRQKPSTSAKVLARYNPGAEIVKLEDAGTANGHTWYKVSAVKDGQTGYMAATYLTYVRSYTENAGASGSVQLPESTDEAGQTNWTVRPQLFEIYRKAGNSEGMTVYARHISYKLLKNATTYEPDGAVTLQDALDKILGNCRIAHDFHAYTDISETRSDVSWHEMNPIKALLDAETGAAAKWGAQVVFDNWDMFFLKRAGRNRGMRIEYGKNLVGVESNEDISNTATRIMPIGKKKDGTDLLLPELYVDSVNIGRYDDPLLYTLECSDCKVSDKMTEEQAFAEMRKRAQDMIDNGCDQPEVSLKVDFVSLGDSEEYAQFREMDKLFMYDEVEVVSERGYADAKAQVVSMAWDCLHDRVLELGVGSIAASLSTGKVASWQIPSGINGGKIAYGSVGSAQLGQDVISARHIQADSINAEAIQAEALTAEKIKAGIVNAITGKFGEIVAGNITTDALYAAMAEIILLRVKQITAETITTDELYAALADVILLRAQQINAGNITTDKLAAQYAEIITLLVRNIKAENIEADRLGAALADFVTMHAGTGEFDFATIQNLVAKALSLQQGSMDTVYIRNLAVTQANILSATLGKLVIKGDDGKYYRVFVGADGTISTEEVGLSVDEVQNGETASGQQIVETSMNVGSLNATNLQANSAVINQILTTALSAEKITAADALIASATIPALYVTAVQAIGGSIDFSANESIRLMVAKKNATFFKNETPTEYVSGDTWIKPDDGTWWIARGMTGKNMPEITSDERFNLQARFGEEAEDYQLVIDEDGYLRVNYGSGEIDEDGYLHSYTKWESLKPSELHTSFIDIAQDKLNIGSGGNVNINAGGELNVNAGAAHFRTAEYSLSILAEDGSEDTIMDFDADGKVLRVSEIEAGNMRPYIAGTTQVTSGEVGGLDGLKGMLERAQYEHIIYIQNAHDMSDEAIEIDCCDSLQVDIIANTLTRVPPLAFRRVTGNFMLRNLEWIASGQTALWMDSGDFVIENCSAEAAIGIRASRNARVVWLGTDENMETAGACDTAIIATEGADARLFGLIPGGQLTESLAGTIKAVNTRVGGNAGGETGKTITIDAEYGYYGTENGWNEDMLYQGYTEGKGRIYGSLKFALPSDVHVISTAVLTLKRDSNAGRGSAANVHIYGSDTAFGERPALGDLYAERDSAISPGASASFDVTLAAQALLSGDIAQLVLYTGESTTATGKVYSRQYARYTAATLKITY